MLKLSGKVIAIHPVADVSGLVLALSTNKLLPLVLRTEKIFLVHDDDVPPGFAHYFLLEKNKTLLSALPKAAGYTLLQDDYAYLTDRDVVKLSKDGSAIRVLFRASSPHNSILVTEQCNHYCLMCSQPPKQIDDSWLLDDIETLIPMIPRDTVEIGFTGGEPTLHGDRFLNILRMTKSFLPKTAVHILSNGRRFSDMTFTKQYAAIEHPDMMVGIPIYSDDPSLHDYIVQADDAFDETLRGVLNLKQLGQKVEIRVVIHQQSVKRLTELADFLARNLLFVDHVALMGLEMMGFTKANLSELWIDPYEYRDTLSSAVQILSKSGMNVSVYNHQLCLVNPDVAPFYRKSISDWKNEYATECKGCRRMNECGGFFSSGIKHGYSKNIRPYIDEVLTA